MTSPTRLDAWGPGPRQVEKRLRMLRMAQIFLGTLEASILLCDATLTHEAKSSAQRFLNRRTLRHGLCRTCLPVYLSIQPTLHLSFYPIGRSVYLSICPSVYLQEASLVCCLVVGSSSLERAYPKYDLTKNGASAL